MPVGFFCSLTIDNILNIIVLLILAGISIAMLSGNNGILQKATDAKTYTERATLIEQAQTDILGFLAENKGEDLDKSQLKSVLDKYFKNVPTELPDGDELLELPLTTLDKYGTHTIKVLEIYNGNVSGVISLQIGDIITNYTSNTALPTGTNWIYFGTDAQGNKLLTTSKPIENKFTLKYTAESWLYYCLKEGDEDYQEYSSELTESNNIHLACRKYSGTTGSTTGTARSITLEDINRVVGFNEESLQFDIYTFISGNTNDYENKNVNYYFPSFLGSKRNDYPYFSKAGEILNNQTVAAKQFLNNYYAYYSTGENDGSYYLEGSNEGTVTISHDENMKYIVGENWDFYYPIASKCMRITESNISFYCFGVYGYDLAPVMNIQFGSAGKDEGWSLRKFTTLTHSTYYSFTIKC